MENNFKSQVEEALAQSLVEIAKPKGIVDKTAGQGKKDPAAPFTKGQRVAHYRGMGQTLHGNVKTPHVVSGGTKGSLVAFSHGDEFVPHKELKDASQYWKDESDSMYKSRKEEVELEESLNKVKIGSTVTLHPQVKGGSEEKLKVVGKDSENVHVEYNDAFGNKKVKEVHHSFIKEDFEQLISEDCVELDEGVAHSYSTKKNDDGSYSWSVSKIEYQKPMEIVHSGKEDTRAKAMARAKKHLLAVRRSVKEEFELEEKLTKGMSVDKWISDFQDSTDPKFDGKSKEERRKMALGAYYGSQNDISEGLKQLPGETDNQFMDRRAQDYVKRQGKSGTHLNLDSKPGARNKSDVSREYSDMIKNAGIKEDHTPDYESTDLDEALTMVPKNPIQHPEEDDYDEEAEKKKKFAAAMRAVSDSAKGAPRLGMTGATYKAGSRPVKEDVLSELLVNKINNFISK
jgi:hypothetical protein